MKFSSITKRFSFLIIFLILGIIFIKYEKIKRYLIEERYYERLVLMKVLDSCYNPTWNFDLIMQQYGFNYEQENDLVIQSSLDKIFKSNSYIAGDLKIPEITHHVYFTFKDDPRLINESILRNLQTSFIKLNDSNSSNWKHYIWTNVPEVFPKELLALKGVEIKNIRELEDHPLYNYLNLLIKKANGSAAYFARASDMLRLMLLQNLGGVYSDLDYEIYNAEELKKLMHAFDFIGGRENLGAQSYYGNAFIAAKPNHPVLNEAIGNLINNYGDISNSINHTKYPCNLFNRVYLNGPVLFTLSYLAANNSDGNIDIILPPWMIYNAEFARYKNGGCNYVIKDQKNLDSIMKYFMKNEKVRAHTDKQGIYYNTKDRYKFPIIGADMFCASWYKFSN